MTCQEAREAMLTADAEELRGLGDSGLAEHVRGCGQCREAATRILRATDLLAERLTSAARTSQSRKPGRQLVQPAWLTLPLAAALAALLLSRSTADVQPVPRVGNLEDVKRPVSQAIVNAPADRNVAVFSATDKITVVWDLGSKGGP